MKMNFIFNNENHNLRRQAGSTRSITAACDGSHRGFRGCERRTSSGSGAGRFPAATRRQRTGPTAATLWTVRGGSSGLAGRGPAGFGQRRLRRLSFPFPNPYQPPDGIGAVQAKEQRRILQLSFEFANPTFGFHNTTPELPRSLLYPVGRCFQLHRDLLID